MKIYKSYGVLAHEYQPVYTVDGPAAEIYDVVNVTLPEGWEVDEGAFGGTLIVSPAGDTYIGNDIISNWGDRPALIWYDNRLVMHRIVLSEFDDGADLSEIE